MTGHSEFIRLCDEMTRKEYHERLPKLEQEIALLEAEIRPIWDEMCRHRHDKQHTREKIYADMEERDWKWTWLVCEREPMLKWFKEHE